MICKQTVLLCLFAVQALTVTAQNEETNSAADDEFSAVEHIKRMKQGTLLVRLQTKENAILLLEVQGDDERADRMWNKQKKINEEIVTAFTYIFDFCPVRFFFSYDSEKVRNGEFEGIFVNRDLKVDSSITVNPEDPVYTAEIGEVYFETFSQHMKGGVFMTSGLEQLRKPFPYVVRKRSGISLVKRTNTDIVKEMNDGLHQFYDQYAKGE